MIAKDKARARELHAQGLSLRRIAAEIGVSYTSVWNYLKRQRDIYVPHKWTADACKKAVYPNLARWILDKEISLNTFAKGCGTKSQVISAMLSGKAAPRYETITAVLAFTGMTFEEAFFREAAGE